MLLFDDVLRTAEEFKGVRFLHEHAIVKHKRKCLAVTYGL